MNKMTSKQAMDSLHASVNSIAKSIMGRISTCTDVTKEVPSIHNDIEYSYKEKLLSDTEYHALTRLCNDLIIESNAIKIPSMVKYSNTEKEVTLVSIFKKRIWAESDLATVIQFRNVVTDMFMLGFLSLDEYIELNNEIDRYIQYALSEGGL